MQVRAEDIKDLRTVARDYDETEALKFWLTELRRVREPLFLSGAELDRIFRWKLGEQFGRLELGRESNPEVAYHAKTTTRQGWEWKSLV